MTRALYGTSIINGVDEIEEVIYTDKVPRNCPLFRPVQLEGKRKNFTCKGYVECYLMFCRKDCCRREIIGNARIGIVNLYLIYCDRFTFAIE